MMQRSRVWGIGAVLGLLFFTVSARADTAAAAAAFKRAQQYQAAKQWGAAVKEYQAALAADPKYVWAYKGLGTTYYQAGDKKGALAYYDKYLAANPGDAQTKAFADKLRGGPSAAAAPAAVSSAQLPGDTASAPAKPSTPFNGGLSLGVHYGMLLAGADDINKPLAGTGFAYGSALASLETITLDYGFKGGMVFGGEFMYGPARTHSVTIAGYTSTAVISGLAFSLNGGYRIRLGNSFWVAPRLGVGYMASAAAYGSTNSSSLFYYGGGYVVVPQVELTKMFGSRFGMNFDLGYMMSSVPLYDDKGVKATLTSSNGTKQDFALSTGGPDFRLGFTWYFRKPLT